MGNMEFLPEDIIKLFIAFCIGTVIGAEREYRSKSAGLRTLILISMGSTLFTIISVKLGGDASRIAANIVTGIGFIGGGIIFRENNRVSGITTAASVWATAALGMAVGDGMYEIAIVGGVLIIFTLYALLPIQNFIKRRNQIRNYRIVCKFQQKLLGRYEALFAEFRLESRRGRQTRSMDTVTGNWMLQGTEKQHEKLIKYLLNDPEVIEFDF
jgi:putative Mg2+ transporter-C (MgtC) family protein